MDEIVRRDITDDMFDLVAKFAYDYSNFFDSHPKIRDRKRYVKRKLKEYTKTTPYKFKVIHEEKNIAFILITYTNNNEHLARSCLVNYELKYLD